jgi:hypothetical protein
MSQPKVKIHVRVRNGVVKDIRWIPSEYSVQVLDYDADKYDPKQLSEDDRESCRSRTFCSQRDRPLC